MQAARFSPSEGAACKQKKKILLRKMQKIQMDNIESNAAFTSRETNCCIHAIKYGGEGGGMGGNNYSLHGGPDSRIGDGPQLKKMYRNILWI